ncbi:MAG: Hsp20/alpha crystallin family protein [Dehalococcoidia bacterium]|jgi:HSP20 family protein|nr:Hsp20/alpha crystallin family protein [Dehalococcoidia bacterium]
MAIEKWHPFGAGAVRDFDDLFNRFFTGGRRSRALRHGAPEAWSIPLDVVQDGDALVVTASLPGATKDEIEVSIDDNVLTIRAESQKSLTPADSSSDESTDVSGSYILRERRTGTYYRALRLPETVDFENAKSTFKDGVLTIKLPKLESKKGRKLEISVA